MLNSFNFSEEYCRVQNPDIQRAGRVGAHGGAAGRSRAGLDANRTVRPGDKGPSYPPRHLRQVAGTSLLKHVEAKSYVNRMRKQNKTLTTGLPAAYNWDEKRSVFLAADQWTDAFLYLYSFHARHVQESPDMPCLEMGRVYRDKKATVH